MEERSRNGAPERPRSQRRLPQRPSAPPKPPRIPVGTTAGRRANVTSFLLVLAAGLAQGWALINLGRALGVALPELAATTTSAGASGHAGLAARLGAEPAATGASATGHLLVALACALVAGACQALAELVSRSSAAQQEAAIRARLLRHLFHLGPARATSTRSGSRVSLLTDGAERIAAYRQTFLAPTLAAAATPAAVLLLLAVTVDWVPAVVLLVAVALIPPFILAVHKKVRRSGSGSRAARMRLSAEYLDAIQGLTTLSLARAAGRTLTGLRTEGERNRRAVMRLLAGNQLVILLTDSLFSLFFVTVAVGLALARLAGGAISLGDALGIVLVAYVLLEPLDHVGAFFYVAMGGLANQRAARRLLASGARSGARPVSGDDAAARRIPVTSPSGSEGAEEQPRPSRAMDGAGSRESSGAARRAGSLAGRPGRRPGDGRETTDQASGVVVRMSDAAARWEPGAPEVLSGVNLAIREGERVAVVGPSGAGKSTLVSLLAGDLLPDAGTVSVAGTALAPATQDAVRAASAVVSQTTWLFTGTIADNLRLADPDASTERMWAALEAVGLADEVRAMPAGLDARLGEQGLGLSGGQAQRVSLARAFLSGRPLLILDEPTSQVDLDSEAVIVEAIERVSQGRTVVTVSHRAGAIAGAERVLAVRGGRVSEEQA